MNLSSDSDPALEGAHVATPPVVEKLSHMVVPRHSPVILGLWQRLGSLRCKHRECHSLASFISEYYSDHVTVPSPLTSGRQCSRFIPNASKMTFTSLANNHIYHDRLNSILISGLAGHGTSLSSIHSFILESSRTNWSLIYGLVVT